MAKELRYVLSHGQIAQEFNRNVLGVREGETRWRHEKRFSGYFRISPGAYPGAA
jgi:hypothetical protein